MLVRYIAGTLLVLGGAMLLAPDAPVREAPRPVVTPTAPLPAVAEAPEAKVPPVAPPKPAPPPEPVAAPESVAAPAVRPLTQAAADAAAEALSADVADLAGNALAAAGDHPASGELLGALAGMTMSLDAPAPAAGARSAGAGLTSVAAPAAPAAPSAGRVLYVTGTTVNVREGPSTNHDVIATFVQGDTVVPVAFEGQDWIRVRVGTGDQTGYIARMFLSETPSDG